MKLDLRDQPALDLSRPLTHCPACGRKLVWDIEEGCGVFDAEGMLYQEVSAKAGRCTNSKCRVVQVAVEFDVD